MAPRNTSLAKSASSVASDSSTECIGSSRMAAPKIGPEPTLVCLEYEYKCTSNDVVEWPEQELADVYFDLHAIMYSSLF